MAAVSSISASSYQVYESEKAWINQIKRASIDIDVIISRIGGSRSGRAALSSGRHLEEMYDGRWRQLVIGWEGNLDSIDVIQLLNKDNEKSSHEITAETDRRITQEAGLHSKSVRETMLRELEGVIKAAFAEKGFHEGKSEFLFQVDFRSVNYLVFQSEEVEETPLHGIQLKSAPDNNSKIAKYYGPVIDVALQEKLNLMLVGWEVLEDHTIRFHVKPFFYRSLKDLVVATLFEKQQEVETHAKAAGTMTLAEVRDRAPLLF